jgi:hypothetical protein
MLTLDDEWQRSKYSLYRVRAWIRKFQVHVANRHEVQATRQLEEIMDRIHSIPTEHKWSLQSLTPLLIACLPWRWKTDNIQGQRTNPKKMPNRWVLTAAARAAATAAQLGTIAANLHQFKQETRTQRKGMEEHGQVGGLFIPFTIPGRSVGRQRMLARYENLTKRFVGQNKAAVNLDLFSSIQNYYWEMKTLIDNNPNNTDWLPCNFRWPPYTTDQLPRDPPADETYISVSPSAGPDQLIDAHVRHALDQFQLQLVQAATVANAGPGAPPVAGGMARAHMATAGTAGSLPIRHWAIGDVVDNS